MILIVGPSGSGKTKLLSRLCQRGFVKVKSCTTRRPRNITESDDYVFLRNEDFENLIRSGAFAEHAEYNSNFYGTLIKDIFMDNAIKIVEPKGFKILSDKYKNIISIYVDVSEEIRKERMMCRGDSEAAVTERLLVDRSLFNDDVKYSCDIIFVNDKNMTEDKINEIIKKIALVRYGN